MKPAPFLFTLAALVASPVDAAYLSRCEAIACSRDVGMLTKIVQTPRDTCAAQALARLVDLTELNSAPISCETILPEAS